MATPEIVIVGAGFGGIGMAIALKRAGLDSFVVLEKDGDLGGTWRANGYPGCACDVPSHLYSYSFALNPDWSRMFSPREEIWDYLRSCVRTYGLMPLYLLPGSVPAVRRVVAPRGAGCGFHAGACRGLWCLAALFPATTRPPIGNCEQVAV